ncbi:hypothetical protein [Deinococcus arenicola]|uniref:Uncharacterized protein n=1 Tax=Deinococcus arenicola TaxID=2994950 RepID=A0ABU4DRN9_9DEIO|nr:hypothetical protein [Deinococcus sp. ZS9-10]MDV6375098.1 hypothetical protein [Deinococcus sp. ZS9-10]
MIDLTVPQQGVLKMKAEANLMFDPDGDHALTLFKMENVTTLLRRITEEGEDLHGDH